jgi:hypothetical protein
MVGAGVAAGGLGAPVLSRFASGRLELAAGVSHSSAYVMDYVTPWGTPGQLVEGTVEVQVTEDFFL